MCIKEIRCIRSEDHANKWLAIDEDGHAYPYSKLFKDKSVEKWLTQGHIIGHKLSENGMIETWTFID